MRFLIQKIDKEIRHDFSFTLLESIRYQKWLQDDPKVISVKYIDGDSDVPAWWFKPHHEHCVPVGSVEFVSEWFNRFHDHTPKPINIPDSLCKPKHAKRPVVVCRHDVIDDLPEGKW